MGTSFSTNGDIADDCWATVVYSSCSVASNTVTITLGEDVSTAIEVYFDDAVVLSSTAELKSGAIEVIAKWSSITLSETNPDADFTINAGPSATLTPDSTTPITV